MIETDRQKDRARERNWGRANSQYIIYGAIEFKLIRARSIVTFVLFSFILVSSTVLKSTATEAYTGKLSSFLFKKTNRNAPRLPINQSVEHKKGQNQ